MRSIALASLALVGVLTPVPPPVPLVPAAIADVRSSPARGSASTSAATGPTRLEDDIVEEHNLLREDPEGYARHVEELRGWFDARDQRLMRVPGRTPILTSEGPRAADEAIEALRALQPVSRLEPSSGMSRGARDHADDQRGGGTGHEGSDGSQPWDRVSRYGTWTGTVGENIAYGGYGGADARLVLLSLVIDDGVPSRGHRDNIVNPAFTRIGVGCGQHAEWGTVCVITYAGGYVEGGP